ncbi:ATP-binding protein [Tropicimonas sp. S265A]|uniref:hybrid sensor histidine kinase/response regulator n=1 Tax=Tropicimonas sp. S265A TaxID=3415134 RepID=UPI003C79C086
MIQRRKKAALACSGGIGIGLATVLLSGYAETIGILVSLTLLAVPLLQEAQRLWATRPTDPKLTAVFSFLEDDRVPSLALDPDQDVIWMNSAARHAYPDLATKGVAKALEGLSKEIAPAVRRLRRAASLGRVADEALVTRHGHVRLVMRGYKGDTHLLRIEPVAMREEASLSHGPVPMLSVSRSGTVLAMNEALRRHLGKRARRVEDVFVAPPAIGDTSAVLRSESADMPVLLHQRPLSAGRREIAVIPTPEMTPAAPLDGLETIPVAVLKLSKTGAILDSNRAARQLLNMTNTGEGALFSELVTGLGRSVSEWLTDAFQAHHPLQPEVMRLRDTAQESYLQVTLSRTDGPNGAALMAVLHDATELKTLEAQFVQSQKMQAIGQLAGGVAHDFNNLLTAISGHCDLILLRHDQGDPDYGDLLQINQNANRAASLVGQLLAFSRKQTLQPEILDIRDTLSDLTHLLNRLVGEKVQLTLVNEPDLAHLRADKRQLEQVLMNLVVNARDAMPDGGEIIVETKSVNLDEPVTRARVTLPAGDYICVTVTDQGVGIPRDKIGKIFEPFYTTKRTGEGTGLGLSTAYGIVKQSGGFIFAESVVGKGTAFELFFPAHHAVASATPVGVMQDEARGNSAGEGVVLLVEDEAPVRAFAARALRLNGFTVLEAENGEMALHLLENPSLSVDLFVSDVVMPGVDGPTWVREALKSREGTPVVFMSGYAEDLLPGAEAELPNSTFLQKPFSLKQLTATVHSRIGTGAAPTALPEPAPSEVA